MYLPLLKLFCLPEFQGGGAEPPSYVKTIGSRGYSVFSPPPLYVHCSWVSKYYIFLQNWEKCRGFLIYKPPNFISRVSACLSFEKFCLLQNLMEKGLINIYKTWVLCPMVEFLYVWCWKILSPSINLDLQSFININKYSSLWMSLVRCWKILSPSPKLRETEMY